MALFRRKKNADAPNMPPELTDYYQAERRDRMGKTWLLGVATLLVTFVVIFGLFMGGRWVVRKLKNSGKKTETTKVTKNVPTPTTKTPSTATKPEAESKAESSTGSSNTTGSSTPTTESNIATSTENNNLPNTGPGNVVAVFVIVSLIGALAHYRFSSSKR